MKEEMIRRILAQESLDLEMWLKRYRTLKFRDYFGKEKPVDQVHESVDRWPWPTSGAHRSSASGHSGTKGRRGRGGGWGVRVGEPVKGLTRGRATVSWPGD
jgi:hypothetical protein